MNFYLCLNHHAFRLLVLSLYLLRLLALFHLHLALFVYLHFVLFFADIEALDVTLAFAH